MLMNEKKRSRLYDIIRETVLEVLQDVVPLGPTEEKLLSTSEAAFIAGVTETTIRRWIKGRKVKGYKVGRTYRVESDELQRYLKGQPANDNSPEELAEKHFGCG